MCLCAREHRIHLIFFVLYLTDVSPANYTCSQFDDWDKRAWDEMTNPPSILLSDSTEITGSVNVVPAVNLPVYMTQYVGGHQIY